MTPSDTIDKMLREVVAWQRQPEQRTAALEAAICTTRPTIVATPGDPLTQTPTERATETVTIQPPHPRPEPPPRCSPRRQRTSITTTQSSATSTIRFQSADIPSIRRISS